MIGMAVNSGNVPIKAQLAADLRMAADKAVDIGLWVDGRQFCMILNQVAKQLEDSIKEERS